MEPPVTKENTLILDNTVPSAMAAAQNDNCLAESLTLKCCLATGN